jgi:hypothetical protein
VVEQLNIIYMKLRAIGKQRKRFLLTLPLVAAPFLCLIFYTFGGGGAGVKGIATKMGLNPELPKARFDLKEAIRNKLGFYKKADEDSIKKNILERLDPYERRADKSPKDSVVLRVNGNDRRADELLQRLGKLKQSLNEPARPVTATPGVIEWPARVMRPARPDTTAHDPQMERLNTLLDKVIRIQHPEERKAERAETAQRRVDEVLPVDSGVNTIAAVAADRQTLVNGATMALRLTDAVRVNGRVIPAGQMVYGVVSVNSDRLQVRVAAINCEGNLYTTDLQVYDVDGLTGIHIPGSINRDVVKESVDEGIGSLDVMSVDGSLGAQAANAGVQAARTLLSRKVRLVRVTVPAGYRVLLRALRVAGSVNKGFSGVRFDSIDVRPPGFVPGGPLIERCRAEGMELGLEGIWLQDSVLWFGLRWENHTAIVYRPDYIRWFVRDRRVFKRTAVQDLQLEPVKEAGLAAVGRDSVGHSWAGFRPFALAKDKELVLEVGEKGGGRVLELVIGHKAILRAKQEP